jgi:hypothetical protein
MKNMNVTKCDICKKTINRKDKIIRIMPEGSGGSFDICHNCGRPVTKFLISKKLKNRKTKKLKN